MEKFHELVEGSHEFVWLIQSLNFVKRGQSALVSGLPDKRNLAEKKHHVSLPTIRMLC